VAFYMIQVSYNTDGWKGLLASPQDRIEAIKPALEQLDGKVVSGWLSFGEYDLVGIAEFPDNVSAAAFSLAVEAGGGVEQYKTTPLLTMEEAQEAMKKAQTTGYKPPQ